MIFSGASASLRGKPGHAQFAAAKAGLRMVAQIMAREYGPAGLHVAHVIIDGGIDGVQLRTRLREPEGARGEDGLLNVNAIAEAYWHLHRQHRSAWTHELDLRPFWEAFSIRDSGNSAQARRRDDVSRASTVPPSVSAVSTL